MRRYLELPPEALIDRLAADYAEQLRSRGPEFRIVGYCLGGLLAAEIARALSESGAVVELTVISSYQPPEVHDELMIEYVFACSMGADLDALGLPSDPDQFGRAVQSVLRRTPGLISDGSLAELDGEFASVGAGFARAAQLSQEDRIAAIHRAASAAGPYHSDGDTLTEIGHYYQVFRHSMRAVGAHRPDPYAGAITLLRNSDAFSLLPGTKADVAAYWGDICLGELTVHDIPGDHFGCMSATNAANLGSLITGTLR